MNSQFLGFILLKEPVCDLWQLPDLLAERWQTACEDVQQSGDALVFFCGGAMVSAAYMPAPVPNGEAEDNAVFNYMWRGAVDAAKQHTAHIMIAVIGKDCKPLQAGEMFVRAAESLLCDPNACGFYVNGTVYEPAYYVKAAQMLRDDVLPVYNLVWHGLGREEDGRLHGYTIGLENFGKDEIEVLHVSDEPAALLLFLTQLSGYVIGQDVTLHDGETIGFTADQKLRITRADSVEFDGKQTLHIEYPG